MADKRRNLGIPSGVVFPFAGTAAPYGYLVCDGSAISRSEYPALFVSLGSGILHGAGDGLTTFNLPDYRGKFMRGLDGTAGNDPDKATRTHPKTGAVVGNVVGSVQTDQTGPHAHASLAASSRDGYPDGAGDTNAGVGYWRYATTYVGTTTNSGNESRPKNANVNYIVKV